MPDDYGHYATTDGAATERTDQPANSDAAATEQTCLRVRPGSRNWQAAGRGEHPRTPDLNGSAFVTFCTDQGVWSRSFEYVGTYLNHGQSKTAFLLRSERKQSAGPLPWARSGNDPEARPVAGGFHNEQVVGLHCPRALPRHRSRGQCSLPALGGGALHSVEHACFLRCRRQEGSTSSRLCVHCRGGSRWVHALGLPFL